MTFDNYLELSSLSPELSWVPVLQGWVREDYLRHAEVSEKAGTRYLFRLGPVRGTARTTGWGCGRNSFLARSKNRASVSAKSGRFVQWDV